MGLLFSYTVIILLHKKRLVSLVVFYSGLLLSKKVLLFLFYRNADLAHIIR